MTTPNLHLSRIVRQHRTARGISRESLAQQAGTSTSTLTRLEVYGAVPKVQTLQAIAQVLELSLDELVGYEKAAS